MLFMPENVIKGIFHLWENEGSMDAKMKKKIRGKYGHISMLTCMKFSKTCGKVDLKKGDSQP
mgnify:CR=1 FL=1